MLIVMIKRSVEDIYASRERARMPNGARVDWDRMYKRFCESYGIDSCNDPVKLIYDEWEWDRHRVPYSLTINYEDLRSHPLWVENRSNWHITQTAA